MTSLTPRQIVAELDRFIIGQKQAKKAVSIALRNRWRRQQVEGTLQDEIVPKNILMIGSTGVGKTEIARRLAKLANAPFIKVEATKFTEIGYVGRDVESIIRDLTEIAVSMVKQAQHDELTPKAQLATENRIVDALTGSTASEETKQKFRDKLRAGELEDKEIEIKVNDNPSNSMPSFDIPGMPGGSIGMMNLGDILGKGFGGKQKTRKMKVSEARDIVLHEETDKLIDDDAVTADAINMVENNGIVFLDEIDKIASNQSTRGGEVSREGVQRDLLPLIEGTIVSTKYGNVKTEHILFIASGAFHVAKPSDLLPELQGRLPIRVELNSLTEEDMIRILKEPEASLIKQYIALLDTDGVKVEFDNKAIAKIAHLATEVNQEVENIGARRLHTIMEKLMEEISFDAPDESSDKLKVDVAYVEEHLSDITKVADLKNFIL